MSNRLFIPNSNNLSIAWAQAFLAVMEHGVTELAPLVISVTDFTDSGVANESEAIRKRLDQELEKSGNYLCHSVANTIFPESMWNPSSENNAVELFTRYDRNWPSINRYHDNRRGVYFRRLTAFQPRNTDGTDGQKVNQLQYILDTFKAGNHRRSALQASILDPTRDNTNSRIQGFPCLQQVGFAAVGNGGLCVTGFYPLQYIFKKAYGNYLGLCRLGRFMAAQMGLSLVQMNCIVANANLGDSKKSELKGLAIDLLDRLDDLEDGT
ncbi:MAG: thymidylate synthase [Acidiferrobacterales bacterium]